MVWCPGLSINGSRSQYTASRKVNRTLQTISKSSNHCSPNLGFFSSHSRIIGSKHLLQQNQENLSSGNGTNHYYSTKSGAQQNQAEKKWYTKIFDKISFESKIIHTLNTTKTEHVVDHPILYFGPETIPYTKRKHIVLVPSRIEKWTGKMFSKTKSVFFKETCILPDKHPDSVRIRSISKHIVEALEKDLQIQQMNVEDKGTVKEPPLRQNRYSAKHLEGLDWEVIVVESSEINACCLPGGKIVVYTGLLEILKSDEEIAFVIGHEVGHIVARHEADGFINNLIFFIIVLRVLIARGRKSTRNNPLMKVIKCFGGNSLSRMQELEADYIGLLLMAIAGYDPKKAPKLYERFDKLYKSEGDTHPSFKERAEALSRDSVMSEANFRYYRSAR